MILSFRFGLSTAAILFMAVVAKLSASLVTEFTVSQVPMICTLVASWLKPPYLYLVINCIIITIFASSKLQEHVTNYYDEPNKIPEDDNYGNANVLVEVMQPHSPLEIKFKYEVSDEFDLNGKAGHSVPESTNSPALVKDVHIDDSNATSVLHSGKSTTENAIFEENNDNIIMKHPVNKMSKPPSSAKIVYQNIAKANPEGKKRVKASMPKRELGTLESTWNAITNRQPMPEHTSCGNLQDQRKLIKSQIFKDQNSSHRIDNMSKRIARSCDPGKLRRDPSLSQDELNKQAEAFINRFKEDMRLQRKESLNRYVEKINRSTY
ncbi:DUF4408 domain-containing protein [Heracleum sosnowskyi]|uniref:DUF4408 domain-containing protein n=1 Tax=Heracleum sosnowskyi TaxID=360622 RepID=A0AAD8N079_9APIA|nr:DUF4408 domain-containing protein [Heracleum sosnowskyi]